MLTIDTAKAAAHLEQASRDAAADKQGSALASGVANQRAATERMDGRFDATDAQQQMGRPMDRREIERRLLTLNPNLMFERSIARPDRSGIYIHELNANPGDVAYRDKKFLTGMEWGVSPEFSVEIVAEVDGEKKHVGRVKGWEAVVIELIRKRVIPQEAACRVFGLRLGRESEARHRLLA